MPPEGEKINVAIITDLEGRGIPIGCALDVADGSLLVYQLARELKYQDPDAAAAGVGLA